MTQASGAPAQPLTTLISWAHKDPDWTDQQVRDRHEQVVRLAAALRSFGIDADADFYHGSESVDWTRWGPARIREVDIVLIIASRAWAQAWEGRGEMGRNIGAGAEADVLRSIANEGRDALTRKCRILVLPGSDSNDIPDGLHGVNRHRISTFDAEGLEDLLRDLTGRPLYPKPPLGAVPTLPPAMTNLLDYPVDPPAPDAAPPNSGSPANVDDVQPGEAADRRRAQLDTLLAALPTPQAGENSDLPWYRDWQRIQRELASLGQRDPQASSEGGLTLDWRPVEAQVDVDWVSSSQQRSFNSEPTAVYVHLLAVPQRRISGRLFASATRDLPDLFRNRAQVRAETGLDLDEHPDRVTVRLTRQHASAYNAVESGGLRGLQLDASGGSTAWAQLPSDNMGSVLDLDRLTVDITHCLSLTAATLASTEISDNARIAVAAEITPTTTITNGTINELGNRMSATMTGGLRSDPLWMKPEETLPLSSLRGPAASEAAAVVADLLQRSWRR